MKKSHVNKKTWKYIEKCTEYMLTVTCILAFSLLIMTVVCLLLFYYQYEMLAQLAALSIS